jgi:hypothetical protein
VKIILFFQKLLSNSWKIFLFSCHFLVQYSLKGTQPSSFSINPAIVCKWQILSTELVGDYLKGPKHEIFEQGLFTQIRLVRVSDLGTKPENSKKVWLGAFYFNFLLHNFLAM